MELLEVLIGTKNFIETIENSGKYIKKTGQEDNYLKSKTKDISKLFYIHEKIKSYSRQG